MPSLRIPFPEKDQPSLIALRSKHITVGRLSDNAIQIPDRTVSAHHAELIAENGHYRVHDVGATNGITVNGQVVSDFHLSEPCKVSFGGVECEFALESPQDDAIDASKALITRAEADALQQEITMLRAQVEAFRQEAETLRQSHASAEGLPTVPQAEFDRVTGELTAMTVKVGESERQFERLKADLGILRRDRDNLQKAYDEALPKTAPEPAPVEAATAETPVETPAPPVAVLPVPEEQPAAPLAEGDSSAAPAPAEPAEPSPAQTLPPPKPKPLFVPGAGGQPSVRPVAPLPSAQPKAPGQLQPAASATPAPAGSKPRPATFAQPAGAPTAKPGFPSYQAKPGVAAKAGIPVKAMAVAPRAVPAGSRPTASPAGPKGTQKLV